jgi:hypothetical protein
MITSAAEARRSEPIADYIALSRALDKLIWQAIYTRQTRVLLPDACGEASLVYIIVVDQPWFSRFLSELEALGYEVSAEGIVSW